MTRAEIERKIENLYDRLDSIEGCEEDNRVYADEIARIRDQISRLRYMDADPEDFELTVTIKGKATVTAETLEDAKNDLYDCLKNNEYMVVESIEIEEV